MLHLLTVLATMHGGPTFWPLNVLVAPPSPNREDRKPNHQLTITKPKPSDVHLFHMLWSLLLSASQFCVYVKDFKSWHRFHTSFFKQGALLDVEVVLTLLDLK